MPCVCPGCFQRRKAVWIGGFAPGRPWRPPPEYWGSERSEASTSFVAGWRNALEVGFAVIGQFPMQEFCQMSRERVRFAGTGNKAEIKDG